MRRILQKNWGDSNPKTKKASNAASVPGTVDFNIEELIKEEKELSNVSAIADPYNPATINTKYFNFVLTQTPHSIAPMYQGMCSVLFY